MDSLGNNSRRATVTTRVFNASKLLGITEIRKLTEEEMERLSKLVEDSLAAIDSRLPPLMPPVPRQTAQHGLQ